MFYLISNVYNCLIDCVCRIKAAPRDVDGDQRSADSHYHNMSNNVLMDYLVGAKWYILSKLNHVENCSTVVRIVGLQTYRGE